MSTLSHVTQKAKCTIPKTTTTDTQNPTRKAKWKAHDTDSGNRKTLIPAKLLDPTLNPKPQNPKS